MLLGVVLVAAPLFVPLSVVGWYGGDAAMSIYVFEKIDTEDQWDYKAQGALIYVQKTDPDQMDPLDVWGGSSPTEGLDGLMTFYVSLGVNYWKVEWNGLSVDGYCETTQEGQDRNIYVHMAEGYVRYAPESGEYIPPGDEPEPDPEPSPPTVEDTLVVVIDSEPVSGYAIAFDMSVGENLGEGDCPFQVTHEGQFPLKVLYKPVDGYVTPASLEVVITEDTRVVGAYIEEEMEPDAPDEPDTEPLDVEEVVITEEEEQAYDQSTPEDPDASGEQASDFDWEARVDILKSGKSPVALFMQLGGVLFIFIGFTQVALPTLKAKRQ